MAVQEVFGNRRIAILVSDSFLRTRRDDSANNTTAYMTPARLRPTIGISSEVGGMAR
jgi:hypothetical protein